jgi:tetratricopeptide (TPR) repeat protein
MSKKKAQFKTQDKKVNPQGNLLKINYFSLRYPAFVFLISLSLIAITLVSFEQVRNNEFINLDDDVYVTENLHVKKGLTAEGVIWAFMTMYASNWHPLTWLSHMLDYSLYGMNPGGHHLTNLIFHIGNTLLLFLVLSQMTGAVWRSSFVAALFALHPLHVESVAWVAERKDVLSTFFWMLTMWAYFRYTARPKPGRYFSVLFIFALGLLSKPMLVTLPVVLLLLDYWPLGRFKNPMNPNGQSAFCFHLILEKVPFFILSAVSSLMTLLAAQEGGTVGSLGIYPLGNRIANGLVSYVNYIGKMIWPSPLAVFYPYPASLPSWQVVGAGLLLMMGSVLIIRGAKKSPYLLVGWFWYLGILVPVIGLVQAGMQAMADRYMYVPLIGLFIMITWGLSDVFEKWRSRKILFAIFAGALLFVYMNLSRIQVSFWRNSITLFEHTLRVTSNNSLIHNNMGVSLVQQGRVQEAILHYNEALRIDPHFAKASYNLGIALGHLGRTQEAIAAYQEALRINPNYPEAYSKVGITLAQLGNTQEAMAYYKKALNIKPDYVEAHNNLGVLLGRQGRTKEAITHFSEALRINPDHAEVYCNLGSTLAQEGNIEGAIHYYNEALRIKPDYAGASYSLGNVLVSQGKIEEAIAHYIKALQVKEDFAEAHFSLGLAYLIIGNRDLALKEYRILETMNPNLANTLLRKF